jgi:hypothetical protein
MRTSLAVALLFFAPVMPRAEEASPEAVVATTAALPEPGAAATPPQSATTAAASVATAPPVAPTPRAASHFGMLLETGVPEGIAVGVTFRPVPSIRFWAGPAWNYLSFGGQLGVTVIPFQWALAPSLSVEGGRYFRADLTRVLRTGSGVPSDVEPLLKDVGYDYAAAHLGLELGSQRGFAFSLRAGLAYLRVKTHGRTQPTSSGAPGEPEVYFVDPSVNATVPSVKLGFHYAF